MARNPTGEAEARESGNGAGAHQQGDGTPTTSEDGARPDATTRLRLVSLRVQDVDLDFGGRLACVAAPSTGAVAHRIAAAVIGPRSADVDGAIDIAGRYVSLQSLPAPLLRPSAIPVVDRAVLDALWQELCARERTRLDAAHASRRLVFHRARAALDRAIAARDEAASPPAGLAVRPAANARVDEERAALHDLVARAAALDPVESPEAIALADEFANAREQTDSAIPIATTSDPADVVALEARVAAARLAVANAAGTVDGGARARIEERHRDVVVAESALFEARRKDRPGALERYQAALAAEHDALTRAGVESYAEFLMAVAQAAAPADPQARLRAELELAQAESELRAASVRVPPQPSLADRDVELRARAAQLLGRFPGDDPEVELRALRLEHPQRTAWRAALVAALDGIGADTRDCTDDDLVAAARGVLDTPPADVEPRPEDDHAHAGSDADAAEHEVRELERVCAEHHRALDALERDVIKLDGLRALAVDGLDAEAMYALLDALFTSYRNGDLLAGRLPLVVDAGFDGITASARDAIAERLRDLDDIQVIVVSADPHTVAALRTAGANDLRWPDAAAPASAGRCAVHADRASAHACGQCARPACVDCLVHVPGESDLWCVGCADAMAARTLRLLRRRGA